MSIHLRFYSALNTPSGNDYIINVESTTSHIHPVIIGLKGANKRFLVAYIRPEVMGIFGKIY